MTTDETRFFELLDSYARIQHKCFLAEMTLWTEALGYTLCLRPINALDDSPARYACKYLKVPVDEVRNAGSKRSLPASITDRLDSELSELNLEG
jgi:hypothetical protein